MSCEIACEQWTQTHVDILKEWKAKCFVYLWLHDKSSYYYTCLENYLSYPIIIFSSISSATLLSSTNNIARYCVASLSLIVGIMTSILRQLRPGELLNIHLASTRRYHALIRQIDACLSLSPSMRPSPDAFIDKIGTEIDNLLANQVDPPERVILEFEKRYGSLDCMLYGEDIIELVQTEITNNKMFDKFKLEVYNRSSMENSFPNTAILLEHSRFQDPPSLRSSEDRRFYSIDSLDVLRVPDRRSMQSQLETIHSNISDTSKL